MDVTQQLTNVYEFVYHLTYNGIYFIGQFLGCLIIAWILQKITKEEKLSHWLSLPVIAIICGFTSPEPYFLGMVIGLVDYLLAWILCFILSIKEYRQKTKKFLFVSYIQNKGIRRICFLLGCILATFPAISFFYDIADSGIESLSWIKWIVLWLYIPFIIACITKWISSGFKENKPQKKQKRK